MNRIPKDDAMLIDIQYIKPGGSKSKYGKHKDYLYIIWKTISTGEKHLTVIPEPKMTIYFEKEQYRDFTYNKNYEYLDRLEQCTLPYHDITKAIIDDIGLKAHDFVKYCYDTQQYSRLEELNLDPYVFGADYDIRAWYRFKWLKNLDNDKRKPITKGFMDIEVDGLESPGMPNPLSDPIDLVTLIDTDTKKSYTFSLVGVECVNKDMRHMTKKEQENEMTRRNMYAHRLKEQEYWVNHIEELKQKAHEMYDESYPGYDFNFYFYKDERKMLIHLFQLVNKLKLDFIGIWNISFDIPYIIERLNVLGLDPTQVMCSPDFPIKECYFKKDKKNFSIKNKSDFFKLSSYTIFYDQMIAYAAIRKSQSELRSHALTYIAQREIGDKKLDYSESGNIKTVSYNNYMMYVLYNIKDVLLQVGIEEHTTDVETYYITSYRNMTPYESEFKETIKLRNLQYWYLYQQKMIPGMNINVVINRDSINEKTSAEGKKEIGFEGAIVGNPLLIDNFGAKLFGVKTNSIFKYSIDFDMSSFYPSTICIMNIDASTLIFKMSMDAKQFDVRGGDLKFKGITDVQLVSTNGDSFKDDVAKEFTDNLQTEDYLSLGYKWLNLPSINEMYDYIKKEINEDDY